MKKFLIIFFLNLMTVGNVNATNSSQMKFQQENMCNTKAITLSVHLFQLSLSTFFTGKLYTRKSGRKVLY